MGSEGCATVYRLRHDAVTWREVDDEVVALDLVNSQYLGVNAAGRVLWMRLASGATEAQLIEALTGRFDVTPEGARVDVRLFLDNAAHRGLLEE